MPSHKCLFNVYFFLQYVCWSVGIDLIIVTHLLQSARCCISCHCINECHHCLGLGINRACFHQLPHMTLHPVNLSSIPIEASLSISLQMLAIKHPHFFLYQLLSCVQNCNCRTRLHILPALAACYLRLDLAHDCRCLPPSILSAPDISVTQRREHVTEPSYMTAPVRCRHPVMCQPLRHGIWLPLCWILHRACSAVLYGLSLLRYSVTLMLFRFKRFV